MNSPLYILDIDGTMMPTHTVDNDCYWAAVHRFFGLDEDIPEVHGFQNVTDMGILVEWVESTLERDPTPSEVEDIKELFLDETERAAARQPDDFRPTSGLKRWLTQELAKGARIAIATGGWGPTARFKIRNAGLDRFNLPLACSDDADTRSGIMRYALKLLGDSQSSTIVPTYFGDGPWDYRACQQLRWPFIGIASGGRARTLEKAGATTVFVNFKPLLD